MRNCWMCKKHQPLATAIGGDRAIEPSDGDISICISCGEWNKFEGDRLVQPDDEDFEFINNDHRCRVLREQWVQMMKRARAH